MTAPGGPGAAAVVARRCAGACGQGVRASAGSGVAPGGRATVNRSGRGARLVSIRRTQGTVS